MSSVRVVRASRVLSRAHPGSGFPRRGVAVAHRRTVPGAVLALVLALVSVQPGAAQDAGRMQILLSNDDGIAEVQSRMIPLVQELRRFADVTVVVADRDRSGTTHMMSVNRKVSLESRLEYTSAATESLGRLDIHVVDGYPADCVVLGIKGILADRPPDLVITGPNGGPNLADGWFGSGTIGAARAAAYLGVPAVAVSGLDDDEPEQVAALAGWVARLARGEIVRSLPAGSYLTVGIPQVPPEEIAGIRLAPRAVLADALRFERLARVPPGAAPEEGTTVWTVTYGPVTRPPGPETDVALHARNFIVITPMKADELDAELMGDLGRRLDELPAWPPE